MIKKQYSFILSITFSSFRNIIHRQPDLFTIPFQHLINYPSKYSIAGMASNPPEGYPDDFIERLLSMPSYPCDGGTTGTSTLGNDERIGAATTATSSAVSQLSSGDEPIAFSAIGARGGGMFPLDLSLASPDGSIQFRPEIANGRAAGGGPVNIEGQFVPLANLIPAFGHVQPHSAQPIESQIHQVFHGQTTTGAIGSVQNPSAVRPKVRARRGQATDPHSIAERLRRERITERVKALQELVPSCSKTDRAAMLDEILDYVKFLRLQVKVLSMSRLGGAGAVAQLVADPQLSVQGDSGEVGNNQQPWDKWSSDGTEQEVAKLMEKDVGTAMQFLQSKALCIMPVSLASAIFSSQQQMDASSQVKPEPNAS